MNHNGSTFINLEEGLHPRVPVEGQNLTQEQAQKNQHAEEKEESKSWTYKHFMTRVLNQIHEQTRHDDARN